MEAIAKDDFDPFSNFLQEYVVYSPIAHENSDRPNDRSDQIDLQQFDKKGLPAADLKTGPQAQGWCKVERGPDQRKQRIPESIETV